jgi:hypothetical protein
MDATASVAVIGGSGLYQMPGLDKPQEYNLSTPFGRPSAPIVVGTLDDQRVAFLARHGIGHHISPTEINYRANIYALKSLGVERIVSISACGSLREDYAPGEIIIPDQLFDFTRGRKRSFFEGGFGLIMSPILLPGPVGQLHCVRLTGRTHKGGSYTIEGPRFSTRVECLSLLGYGDYRNDYLLKPSGPERLKCYVMASSRLMARIPAKSLNRAGDRGPQPQHSLCSISRTPDLEPHLADCECPTWLPHSLPAQGSPEQTRERLGVCYLLSI